MAQQNEMEFKPCSLECVFFCVGRADFSKYIFMCTDNNGRMILYPLLK